MSESAILFRLADQLDEHAATLRSRGRRLALAAEQVRWHSTAADVFRSRARAEAGGLHRAAGGVERAAGALRSHARTVRRLEQIAAVAERAAGELVRGASTVTGYLTGWI